MLFIELVFIASNFQCGASAPLAEFEVIVEEQNNEGASIFHTLSIGESIVLEKDKYINATINNVANANCMQVFKMQEATVDTIPELPGLYDQPAVASYLDQLQDAESIYLYEFGSVRGPSADYQDVVIKIDWDYTEIDKEETLPILEKETKYAD